MAWGRAGGGIRDHQVSAPPPQLILRKQTRLYCHWLCRLPELWKACDQCLASKDHAKVVQGGAVASPERVAQTLSAASLVEGRMDSGVSSQGCDLFKDGSKGLQPGTEQPLQDLSAVVLLAALCPCACPVVCVSVSCSSRSREGRRGGRKWL